MYHNLMIFLLGVAMLEELFPKEKITKEVKASLDLLVSAFVSLAEDLLREEELQEDEESK